MNSGGTLDDHGTAIINSTTLAIDGGTLTVETDGQLNISSDSTLAFSDGGTDEINGSVSIDGGQIVTQATGTSSIIDGDLYYSFDLSGLYYGDEPITLSGWSVDWGDGSVDTYSVSTTCSHWLNKSSTRSLRYMINHFLRRCYHLAHTCASYY